jgi:hypothetical protein
VAGAEVVKVRIKRARRKRVPNPPPSSPREWFEEIVLAYRDAADTIAIGPLLDLDIKPGDLFHLAPAVCVKFRGMKASKRALKKATEAALTSYVATTGREPEALSKPQLAFAFCYLASHFGIDLLTEADVAELMDFFVENEQKLGRRSVQRGRGDRSLARADLREVQDGYMTTRLYRGLKEPYQPEKVGGRQQGATPGMFGTDFSDCPYAALQYAQGRRGVMLVVEPKEGLRVTHEMWGLRDEAPKRLMIWGGFDDFIVAQIPAKELRKHVRAKGIVTTDDNYKAVVLKRAIEEWMKNGG